MYKNIKCNFLATLFFSSLLNLQKGGIIMSNDRTDRELIFYVSPIGNDKWSGRLPEPNEAGNDGPFATITKARDTLRNMKKQGTLSWPVKVYLRGGIYYLTKPIVFTYEDSWPITYCATH